MAEVVVKPVLSRREKKLFLQYPWKQYAGDPIWIPPLRSYQKEQVGYAKNPFYDRNEIQTFLALRGGEVCGRIAAILNVAHNEHHKENIGFWGFFESIDDQEVGRLALLCGSRLVRRARDSPIARPHEPQPELGNRVAHRGVRHVAPIS